MSEQEQGSDSFSLRQGLSTLRDVVVGQFPLPLRELVSSQSYRERRAKWVFEVIVWHSVNGNLRDRIIGEFLREVDTRTSISNRCLLAGAMVDLRADDGFLHVFFIDERDKPLTISTIRELDGEGVVLPSDKLERPIVGVLLNAGYSKLTAVRWVNGIQITRDEWLGVIQAVVNAQAIIVAGRPGSLSFHPMSRSELAEVANDR
ncbi:hypothetical protein JW766_03105 [Candidatus Dojkabacteria bacterium]|nr:hypothetical protein [Candidatus Dojkabacteria bacterium]